MLNRLSSYFLIVSAVVFTAIQGFAIIKHVRLEAGVTTPDYINALKIVVAQIAIVVATWSLKRDKRSSFTKQLPSPSRAPRSFGDAVRQVSASSIRNPMLTPLLILSFMIVPVGLYALAKPHGWNDFGIRDWSLIGVAEIPFMLLTIFSVIVGWRARAKKK